MGQTRAIQGEELWESPFDKNNDGVISEDEARTFRFLDDVWDKLPKSDRDSGPYDQDGKRQRLESIGYDTIDVYTWNDEKQMIQDRRVIVNERQPIRKFATDWELDHSPILNPRKFRPDPKSPGEWKIVTLRDRIFPVVAPVGKEARLVAYYIEKFPPGYLWAVDRYTNGEIIFYLTKNTPTPKLNSSATAYGHKLQTILGGNVWATEGIGFRIDPPPAKAKHNEKMLDVYEFYTGPLNDKIRLPFSILNLPPDAKGDLSDGIPLIHPNDRARHKLVNATSKAIKYANPYTLTTDRRAKWEKRGGYNRVELDRLDRIESLFEQRNEILKNVKRGQYLATGAIPVWGQYSDAQPTVTTLLNFGGRVRTLAINVPKAGFEQFWDGMFLVCSTFLLVVDVARLVGLALVGGRAAIGWLGVRLMTRREAKRVVLKTAAEKAVQKGARAGEEVVETGAKADSRSGRKTTEAASGKVTNPSGGSKSSGLADDAPELGLKRTTDKPPAAKSAESKAPAGSKERPKAQPIKKSPSKSSEPKPEPKTDQPETVELHHGSKDTSTFKNGKLDPNSDGHFYSGTNPDVAKNAIKHHKSFDQAPNPGVIKSKMPKDVLDSLIKSGDVEIREGYKGFGGTLDDTVEYVFKTPKAKRAFNKYIEK